MNNRFYFDKDFGFFIGQLTDNKPHKHYAQQISIAATGSINVYWGEKKKLQSKGVFINTNVPHHIDTNSLHLTILINPLSATGHFLHNLYLGKLCCSLDSLDEYTCVSLSSLLSLFSADQITFPNLTKRIVDIMYKLKCSCEEEIHVKNEKVFHAIKYMEKNFDEVLSLKDVAAYSCISETRFLHLFKQYTGLRFRRYQLWNRLIKSLPYLMQHTIADTAYSYGFTDNSHYTRTFVESFGISPSLLLYKK